MNTRIYVGNLPYAVTDATLGSNFSEFGGVSSAKVMMDRETGQSKGFGFVEMTSAEAAQAAITGLHGMSVDGRQITVNLARPREAAGGMAALNEHYLRMSARDAKDQVFVTCMPWLDFTSIQHPMVSLATPDIPSLAWGKFRDGPEGLQLPFSVQAHHGFVDGYHIHLLARRIAAELQAIMRA